MRMRNLMCIKSMRSFSMSGPFERRASDGIDKYGEKAMKGDEGSSESSSLLTKSQLEKKILADMR